MQVVFTRQVLYTLVRLLLRLHLVIQRVQLQLSELRLQLQLLHIYLQTIPTPITTRQDTVPTHNTHTIIITIITTTSFTAI